MISYFLPLHAGAVKKWGTPKEDFWCCHGTLVQAHSAHCRVAFLEDDDGLVINQYIPSEVEFSKSGSKVKAVQKYDNLLNCFSRPQSIAVDIDISAEAPVELTIRLRIPWWVKGDAALMLDGKKVQAKLLPSSYYEIRQVWNNNKIQLVLPKALYTCSLPDATDTVAFMDGPAVLAGLCSEERILNGDIDKPDEILVSDNERVWGIWKNGYRTRGQDFGFKFLPLYEISDEKYQVYFQIKSSK